MDRSIGDCERFLCLKLVLLSSVGVGILLFSYKGEELLFKTNGQKGQN